SHEGLALAAVGHRQPADEVGEPDVGGPLLLGVLVEVVVELPRLVADPEIELVVPYDIVKEHEVREQDLVHPPDRLEAVQIVFRALALDVPRLVREVRAGRVDVLAARLEHRGYGMLRQPLDLELRLELPKLVRNCDVPLRMS